VPFADIASDISGDAADSVHFFPSVVHCERVVFAAQWDFGPDEDLGEVISLERLRRDPEAMRFHLAQKRTPHGRRPALEMLAEALARARTLRDNCA